MLSTKTIHRIVTGMIIILLSAHFTTLNARVILKTKFLQIIIDRRGYITEFRNIYSGSPSFGRNFSPAGQPSPVMCLLKKDWSRDATGNTITSYRRTAPVKAIYKKHNNRLILDYEDGERAEIVVCAKSTYITFELVSLTNYDNSLINAVIWGPYKTIISNLFGEVIGVARDTSQAVNYAIGLLGTDSITAPGLPPAINSYGGESIVHNPDPRYFTLPDGVQEGQRFPFCGFGGYDVDFFCHPEEYFRVLGGTAALPDTATGGITLMYHSKNATIADTLYASGLPGYAGQPFRHWINSAKNKGNTNFTGTSVALYGSPDDSTLLSVLKPIVINEGMPFITDEKGVWIRDPSSVRPDMFWWGECDSVYTYAKQWGCNPGIQHEGIYNQLFYPNPGTDQLRQPDIPLLSGEKVSPDEFRNRYALPGIYFGAHTLSLFLNNTQNNIDQSDVSPYAGSGLATCNSTVLSRDISASDSVLFVTDTMFWGKADLGSYLGPQDDKINYFRIGTEILCTSQPVNLQFPYSFTKVKRGQFRTFSMPHHTGDTIYKLLRNCYNGLYPTVDLMITKYADYYGLATHIWGGYIDYDGGIGSNWNSPYESLMFLKRVHSKARELGTPSIRNMSGALSYEGWFYITAQNNGYLCDGNNLTWNNAYTPGHNGSEGKDLRNMYFANFYTVSTHGPSINEFKSIPHFEHFESFSVGWDASYALQGMSIKSVEALGADRKAAYFKIIRTWESARAANAFPAAIKRSMRDPSNYYHLEQLDENLWELYVTNMDGKLKDDKGVLLTNSVITNPPLMLERNPAYSPQSKH
ncbi:MAG TPA: hypothetical protein PK796_07340 [Bacteroidales bacterium]|nr:hypothetical protein [Bacteroidales bacterium]